MTLSFDHVKKDYLTKEIQAKGWKSASFIILSIGMIVIKYLERKVFDVTLKWFVIPRSSNETFYIIDGVFRVPSDLVSSSISYQSFTCFFPEGNIRWRNAIALVIGYDINSTLLVYSNTIEKNMKGFLLAFKKANKQTKLQTI